MAVHRSWAFCTLSVHSRRRSVLRMESAVEVAFFQVGAPFPSVFHLYLSCIGTLRLWRAVASNGVVECSDGLQWCFTRFASTSIAAFDNAIKVLPFCAWPFSAWKAILTKLPISSASLTSMSDDEVEMELMFLNPSRWTWVISSTSEP